MESLLQIRDLRKSFGSLRALDGVNLDVKEKEVHILIGPNGSGKTTLINVVSGLHKADSGSVTYAGSDITGIPPHKVYAMGLSRTFQIPNLFTKLTVMENVLVATKDNPGESFVKSLFKRSWVKEETEATRRAFTILQLLGLDRVWDREAATLSGGQMKLLELARALMSGGKLILLDEPISGVNPTLAHEIFGRIIRLRDELGVTFLIVEHRLEIALSYVDVVTAMAQGIVIAAGKPEQVMSDSRVIEAYLGA
ncbi:MAG: ABC transporter ATP-binding protein [Nitrososphaerota archaeon]|nr:ABC transporter ATP-binding protein [Nitrososphaerota archaeon]MDG7024201.1 ABC transporter ATP-binding protein [Nitrososphaerota archaeon]